MPLAQLKSIFSDHGFPLVGAVSWEKSKSLYNEHFRRYDDWIQAQGHSTMAYLDRGRDRRRDPALVFPQLKTVIAVARPYPVARTEGDVLYARYLQGDDYHEKMQESLNDAMIAAIRAEVLPAQTEFKVCVDTSAVLERTWAALCGLGWIGKNTLLIHPQFGSFLFLGVVLTNVDSDFEPTLHADYCGNCERCLTGCPTKALTPHWLESEKCIAYRTLEHRGDWATQKSGDDLHHKGYVAGCDICQEVCPFNLKVLAKEKNSAPVFSTAVSRKHWNDLLIETPDQYLQRVQGTALSRVKPNDFDRNLMKVFVESFSSAEVASFKDQLLIRDKHWPRLGWNSL